MCLSGEPGATNRLLPVKEEDDGRDSGYYCTHAEYGKCTCGSEAAHAKPPTVAPTGEDAGFIIESALALGFTVVDDNATVFQCTADTLVKLVTAYRTPAAPTDTARKLRAALVGLVGEEDPAELKQMAEFTGEYMLDGVDKAAMLTAIEVLIETAGVPL